MTELEQLRKDNSDLRRLIGKLTRQLETALSAVARNHQKSAEVSRNTLAAKPEKSEF